MNDGQTEKNITLELSINEVNVVIGALRELPHRVVADLITKVVAQAQKQIEPVAPPSDPAA